MESRELLEISVVYALPETACLISLQVQKGCTVKQAIETSHILEKFPEIVLDSSKIGIFSKPVGLDTVLSEGDRIEIYRSLKVDPKEARRKRAGGN